MVRYTFLEMNKIQIYIDSVKQTKQRKTMHKEKPFVIFSELFFMHHIVLNVVHSLFHKLM